MEDLRVVAEQWAEQMFEPLADSDRSPTWPGRQTVAVIVQVADRDDDRSSRGAKRQLDRHRRAGQIMQAAREHVKAGDLESARSTILSGATSESLSLTWCDDRAHLAEVLLDCLHHGEQCYESGPEEGPAGRVVSMSIWYDSSHPVG